MPCMLGLFVKLQNWECYNNVELEISILVLLLFIINDTSKYTNEMDGV